MLSSIPEGIKEVAYSLTHLCYNLLGYLPAPILYGLVCSVTGGTNSRFGLVFLMMFSLLGVFFLFLATHASRLSFIESEERQAKEESSNNVVKTKSFDAFERKLSEHDFKIVRRMSSIETSRPEALSLFFGRPSFIQ